MGGEVAAGALAEGVEETLEPGVVFSLDFEANKVTGAASAMTLSVDFNRALKRAGYSGFSPFFSWSKKVKVLSSEAEIFPTSHSKFSSFIFQDPVTPVAVLALLPAPGVAADWEEGPEAFAVTPAWGITLGERGVGLAIAAPAPGLEGMERFRSAWG